jgi:hypothetical protein
MSTNTDRAMTKGSWHCICMFRTFDMSSFPAPTAVENIATFLAILSVIQKSTWIVCLGVDMHPCSSIEHVKNTYICLYHGHIYLSIPWGRAMLRRNKAVLRIQLACSLNAPAYYVNKRLHVIQEGLYRSSDNKYNKFETMSRAGLLIFCFPFAITDDQWHRHWCAHVFHARQWQKIVRVFVQCSLCYIQWRRTKPKRSRKKICFALTRWSRACSFFKF